MKRRKKSKDKIILINYLHLKFKSEGKHLRQIWKHLCQIYFY